MCRIASILFLCCCSWAAVATAAPGTRADVSAVLNVSALQPGQTAVVAVVLDIHPGFHVQSATPSFAEAKKLELAADANPAVEFLPPIYPPGRDEFYPKTLGRQNVYTGRVIVYLPMRVKADAGSGPVTISGTLRLQACDENVCYKPEQRPFHIDTRIIAVTELISTQNTDLFSGFDPRVFAQAAAPAPESSTTIDFFGRSFELGKTRWLLALSLAFVIGIIFNLMPCVLPVLPLKAIGFYEVAQHRRARCLMLGGVFSLGVMTCFAVLALFIIVPSISSSQFSWGKEFSSAWFAWPIIVILTAMALGMFGLFEVVVPQRVYSLTPRHDTVWGNYLFGILTGILSTPCTAPMFPGLLAWAALQPVALGVATIEMVGIGMAFPYLALSAFPGLARRVPRAGPWSLVLKQMMGFLVLAVAVYFAAGRLIHGTGFIWSVFVVVVAACVFLVIRTVQLSNRLITRSIVTVVAILVCGLALGGTVRLTGGSEWQPYSDQALADGRASGRPVLIECTANWCSNCIALELKVYHDPLALEAIKKHNVILLRADVSEEDAPGWKIVTQLNQAGGIPLTAIYGPGKEEPVKLTSVYTTQNLIDALDRATSPRQSSISAAR